MPPRRSTSRKDQAESADTSALLSTVPSEASEEVVQTPPRRMTRGRRATAKAAAASSDTPTSAAAPSPKPAAKSRSRTSRATAAERASAMERVHTLPTRTNPRLGEVKSRQVKLQIIRREDKYVLRLTPGKSLLAALSCPP